ncbi:MAG: PorV/PorQ family protein [Bacteroidetes bacterium]|nr:PorV/PorQ family protein [Bacteroidota bacterium]
MKHTTKNLSPTRFGILTTVLAGIILSGNVFAGNQDRSGQAGAPELLINPWARTSGWAGANIAGVRGLEGQFLNVAGTAFTKKTELLFARTNYLKGSDININAFGFSQKVGASGVLALSIAAMNFGDVEVTTTELPEGGLGTYSINFMNIGLSYAKGFTDHIFGGMCVRVINQQIPDARAGGMALDAGIQYVAGKSNNVHFGISLKNVGPKMQFTGDGLSFRTLIDNGTTTGSSMTVDQRSESFELPSQVNIGGAYDYYVGGDTANKTHRVTLAGAFISNSFTKDEFRLGVEYGFKSFLMLRAGYGFEKGIGTDDDTKDNYRTTAQKGLSAGFTIELPLNKEKGSTFGLDYSYRATSPFDGTHSIGVRMNL